MSGNEGEDNGLDVVLRYGEVTEEDLGLVADDIQQLVVAPTDWTIGVLIDLLRTRKIDMQPNYQRRVAWDETKMSRFIESLFMRLPVPQIVLAEMRPGVFAVIDGKQRINSLARFCLDENAPLRLSGCEYRSDLNTKSYDDLQADPGEQNNLYLQETDQVARLLSLLTEDISRGRSTEGASSKNDVEDIILWKSEATEDSSSSSRNPKRGKS